LKIFKRQEIFESTGRSFNHAVAMKSRYSGHERRGSDEEEESEKPKERLRDLLSKLLRRNRKTIALKKALTAKDWFKRGFQTLHSVDDDKVALRAFAMSIDLDPAYQRAYLNQGITYEMVGNLQQAIYDYSRRSPIVQIAILTLNLYQAYQRKNPCQILEVLISEKEIQPAAFFSKTDVKN
jgi:hypothetical protein